MKSAELSSRKGKFNTKVARASKSRKPRIMTEAQEKIASPQCFERYQLAIKKTSKIIASSIYFLFFLIYSIFQCEDRIGSQLAYLLKQRI